MQTAELLKSWQYHRPNTMQHISIMEMPMPQQFSSAGLVLDNCTKNTILSTVHKNNAAKMCKVYIRYDNFCQVK